MHLIGLILLAIAKVLKLLINLYTIIVAIAVIVSWVNPDPYNPIVRFLSQATEPAFRWVQRFLPRSTSRIGFDISPIIVFILLIIIETVFVGLLFEWSEQLLAP